MTRRNRVTKLEATAGDRIGPEDWIGVYMPDLEQRAFVDQYGRTLPMSDEEHAELERAFASRDQPDPGNCEDGEYDNTPPATFQFVIAPVASAKKR